MFFAQYNRAADLYDLRHFERKTRRSGELQTEEDARKRPTNQRRFENLPPVRRALLFHEPGI